MIATTALVFALGALVATLLALLFIPIQWRRAQRLAWREFEASVPTTAKELRAEADALRAEAAFAVSRESFRAREAGERAAAERAEAGRAIIENGQLIAAANEARAREAAVVREFEAARAQIADMVAERDRLAEARRKLAAELDRRMGEVAELSDQRAALAAELDMARRQIALLRERAEHPAPRPSADEAAPPLPRPAAREAVETVSGGNRLRAAIRARGASEGGDAAENADLRERISDMAARVIQSELRSRGAGSALSRLFEGNAGASPAGAPPCR